MPSVGLTFVTVAYIVCTESTETLVKFACISGEQWWCSWTESLQMLSRHSGFIGNTGVHA